MSVQTSNYQDSLSRAREDDWRGRYDPARREGGGLSLPLLVGGLVAAGVIGFLVWDYIGPDLRRYMKIRDM
jgi:hypothetical protein